MPTWVKTNKEQSNAEINEQYDVVDINSFSEMQKLAYDIVHSHFKSNSDDQDPLCLIIIGVGKSYLINAIRSLIYVINVLSQLQLVRPPIISEG